MEGVRLYDKNHGDVRAFAESATGVARDIARLLRDVMEGFCHQGAD